MRTSPASFVSTEVDLYPADRDLSKTPETLQLKVDVKAAGLRLDRYLSEKFPWRSRTGIQKLIEEGKILRQQPGQKKPTEATRVAARLVAGEILIFLVPEKPQQDLSTLPVSADLSIVYEDPHLLAVDKPPYMAVHPSARYRTNTLISLLHARYRDPDPHKDIVPKLCHRIDRETSGLVLVAKDDITRGKIGKIFEGRRVEKEYLAIVEGEVKDRIGKIDLPLAPARESQLQIRMEARHDGKGLPSMTEWEVIERYPSYTLVAARPKTGRQHQIRVHLAAIGHPIIGDKIYGPDENYFLKSLESELSNDDLAVLKMGRQALHAHKLKLEHPALKKPVEFEAPLPPDMKAFLDGLS